MVSAKLETGKKRVQRIPRQYEIWGYLWTSDLLNFISYLDWQYKHFILLGLHYFNGQNCVPFSLLVYLWQFLIKNNA